MNSLTPMAVAPRQAFFHHGKGGEVWRIAFKNFAFGILTLGFYRFWGATNLRRYFWSRTELDGEPLEYTGTGKELFVGFLLALVVVGLPIFGLVTLIQIAIAGEDFTTVGIGYTVLMLLLAFLTPFATYRALRYRMTRTVWRGLRGNLSGSAVAYAGRAMAWLLAMGPTLGLIAPVRNTALRRYRTVNTSFGDRYFAFDGQFGQVYHIFALTVLLGIILLVGTGTAMFATAQMVGEEAGPPAMMGLVWLMMIGLALLRFAYDFAEWRYFMGCTSFGEARLSFTGTTASFLRLLVVNFLMTAATLGLGAPYAQLRMIRYLCANTRVSGLIEVETLRHDPAAKPRQGEGLVDLLDTAEF